ncbi:hypothetical protein F5887DRAFT_1076392 [Amanita rubescens]|nr:hypothetical protein F5887DRAFT_1076392 [Amanita rubescens]
MSLFTISSVQTKYSLVSDGTERPGERVKTVSEQDKNFKDTILRINPPVQGPATISAVQGKTGLYVAAQGNNLVWSSEPFDWAFYLTPGGIYQIVVPGQDLYWFDKFGIGNTVIHRKIRPRFVEQRFSSTLSG